jgi:hypothetical protein
MERSFERGDGRGSIQVAAVCCCADEQVESPFAVLASWRAKEKSESQATARKASGRHRTGKGSGSGNR